MISSSPGQLDAGQHDVGLDRLAHPAEVDQREAEDEGAGHGPGGQLDELLEVGVAEGLRGGGGRRHAGRHDGEGDHEGQEVDAERLVRVQRGPGGLRVLADQLQVAERGEVGHHERQHERDPERPADLPGDRPGQRVDAGAQDVADDEEDQQSGPDGTLEWSLEFWCFGCGGQRDLPRCRFGEVSARRYLCDAYDTAQGASSVSRCAPPDSATISSTR
jgi:hypothetical protein